MQVLSDEQAFQTGEGRLNVEVTLSHFFHFKAEGTAASGLLNIVASMNSPRRTKDRRREKK